MCWLGMVSIIDNFLFQIKLSQIRAKNRGKSIIWKKPAFPLPERETQRKAVFWAMWSKSNKWRDLITTHTLSQYKKTVSANKSSKTVSARRHKNVHKFIYDFSIHTRQERWLFTQTLLTFASSFFHLSRLPASSCGLPPKIIKLKFPLWAEEAFWECVGFWNNYNIKGLIIAGQAAHRVTSSLT
jgi:hypothetical protein